jgi:hypothetical protein
VSEWDEFKDVYESGLWSVGRPDKAALTISGPVFVEGEVTWKLAESGGDPTTAASEPRVERLTGDHGS